MSVRYCLFLLLLATPLFGAQRESALLQEMRLGMQQFERQVHSYKVELDLMHERVQALEAELGKSKRAPVPATLPVEGRLVALEKAQEALASDLKILKGNINQTSTTLSSCQKQLSRIDKQLTTDIQSLKKSIGSMLALLGQEAGSGKSYIVKMGDSLGQIAIEHKTSIKTLKELNNLSKDTIFPGQKLLLP